MNKIFNAIIKGVKKNSPAILTGMGLLGMASAVVTTIIVAPKAANKINERKEEIAKEQDIEVSEVKVPVKEVASLTWKLFLPVAIEFTTSTACILGAQSINTKRQAVLETACAISSAALTDYKAKVIETIGEKQEEEIEKEVAKDRVESKPVDDKNNGIKADGTIILPNNVLCMDVYMNHYFRSDKASIEKAVKEVVKRLPYESITVNEFYDFMDVDNVPAGDNLMWNSSHGMDVKYGSTIAPNGEPCLTIIYTKKPTYDAAIY